MDINYLNNILKSLGFSFTLPDISGASPVYLFALGILILSVVSLLCVIEIVLYVGILYYSDSPVVVSKLSKYPLLSKLFNFYKKTRIAIIVYSVILLLVCLSSIIWLSFSVVYGLS